MSKLVKECEIAIIGGGVAGCASLYHLSKLGMRNIVLIESTRLGGGASGRSAAMVMQQTCDEVLSLLARESLRDYFLFSKAKGHQLHIKTCGSVLFASSEANEAKLLDVARMQRGLGIETQVILGKDLQRAVPKLNTEGIRIGLFCEDDGYMDQWSLISYLTYAARDEGAEILIDEGVEQVSKNVDGTFVVQLASLELHAKKLVLAAGALTSRLANQLNVAVPLTFNRRHLAIVRPRSGVGQMAISECIDDEWYVRPQGEQDLLVGVGPTTKVSGDNFAEMMEPARDSRVLRTIHEYLQARYPKFADYVVPSYWAGVRGMTADDRPIIGLAATCPGLYLCCGFSAFGITHASASGNLLAHLVADREVPATMQRVLDSVSPSRPSLVRTASKV